MASHAIPKECEGETCGFCEGEATHVVFAAETTADGKTIINPESRAFLCCKHFTALFGDLALCDLPTAADVLIEGGLRMFKGLIKSIAADPEAAEQVMQKAWERSAQNVTKEDGGGPQMPTGFEKAGGAPCPKTEEE